MCRMLWRHIRHIGASGGGVPGSFGVIQYFGSALVRKVGSTWLKNAQDELIMFIFFWIGGL